jgi:RHS repeat-associated protein
MKSSVSIVTAYQEIQFRVAKSQSSQNATGDLNLVYAYNGEGKLTGVTYPTDAQSNTTPSYSYTYDPMMRLTGASDLNSVPIVNGVQYNAANQLTNIHYYTATETRTYNSLFQLSNISTTVQGGTGINLTYNYTGGANNGKIASLTDAISGETVSYQYDALNRLISASASGWTQTQSYDGFGNLTGRTGTGTAQSTTISTPADPTTNRLTGYSYDANGNQISTGYSYDAENRIVTANAGTVQYFYDAQNKRIWQGNCNPQLYFCPGTISSDGVTLFGADGKLIATYGPVASQSTISFYMTQERSYFGGKLVGQLTGSAGFMQAAVQDRLGSVGKYYPYGEERNAPQLTNDQVKFATYTRDNATGLDYADQRYYTSALGRFMTPDRYWGSASLRNPQSWNRYAYVLSDPVNHNDPFGLCDDVVAGIDETSTNNSESTFANSIGAMQAYPYAGTDHTTGVAEVGIGGVTSNTWNALTVAASINQAAADSSGPINLFIFSGGAQAFADAIQYLSAAVIGRISAITYASPGMIGTPATVNGIVPTVVFGMGTDDIAATAMTVIPGTWNVIKSNCGHDASCEFDAAMAAGVGSGDKCDSPAAISSPIQPSLGQAIAMSLAALATSLGNITSFNPFGYLNVYGPPQYISSVFSTISYPAAEPLGCVTTPGLNGGPAETVCH